MENAIYYRRSCRSYSSEPLTRTELAEIEDFSKTLVPLDNKIRTAMQIVPGDAVRFYFPWKAPQLIAFFSENKPGYLENAGFLLQQMDLWLQSRGLGVCWLGLGKPKNQVKTPEGMEFVILLAFGTPKEPLRKEPRKFSRKAMAEISDQEDPKLECVRVAPSSTNSQPWYFTHEDQTVHAFRSEAGLLRHAMLGTMNRIDMGIALAHPYVENKESFRYFSAEPTQIPAGHCYTGSFTL